MQNLEKRIRELIDFEIEREFFFSSIDEIEKFENSINFELPDDYKWFLFTFCDCIFHFDAIIKIIECDPRCSDGYSYTAVFYGSDIAKRRKSELYIHEDQYLPIGGVDGYSLCMGMTKDNYGKIYTWVFDEPNIDGTQYYLTAESFTDYIMRVVLPSEKEE